MSRAEGDGFREEEGRSERSVERGIKEARRVGGQAGTGGKVG